MNTGLPKDRKGAKKTKRGSDRRRQFWTRMRPRGRINLAVLFIFFVKGTLFVFGPACWLVGVIFCFGRFLSTTHVI